MANTDENSTMTPFQFLNLLPELRISVYMQCNADTLVSLRATCKAIRTETESYYWSRLYFVVNQNSKDDMNGIMKMIRAPKHVDKGNTENEQPFGGINQLLRALEDPQDSDDEDADTEKWDTFKIEDHKFTGNSMSHLVDRAATSKVQSIIVRGARFTFSECLRLEEFNEANIDDPAKTAKYQRQAVYDMANRIGSDIVRALPQVKEIIIDPTSGDVTGVMAETVDISPRVLCVIRMEKQNRTASITKSGHDNLLWTRTIISEEELCRLNELAVGMPWSTEGVFAIWRRKQSIAYKRMIVGTSVDVLRRLHHHYPRTSSKSSNSRMGQRGHRAQAMHMSIDVYKNFRAAENFVQELELQEKTLLAKLALLAGETFSEQRKLCRAEFLAAYENLGDLRPEEDIEENNSPWEEISEDDWTARVIWPFDDEDE
jgi:hypothetical protein